MLIYKCRTILIIIPLTIAGIVFMIKFKKMLKKNKKLANVFNLRKSVSN